MDTDFTLAEALVKFIDSEVVLKTVDDSAESTPPQVFCEYKFALILILILVKSSVYHS